MKALDSRIGGQSKIDHILMYLSRDPIDTQTKIVFTRKKRKSALSCEQETQMNNLKFLNWHGALQKISDT